MKRKLFLGEFKRALIPTVVTLGAFYVLALLSDRIILHFGGQSDTRDNVNYFLGVLLVASGFLSGARAFSKEFKTSHSLLLQTLPVSRGWIWFLLVSSSLSVSLACVTAVVFLRSGMLIIPQLTVIGFCLYLFLFAAGCCFALLHERPYLAYLVGYLTVAVVAGLLVVYAQYYSNATIITSLVNLDQPDAMANIRLIIEGLLVLFFLYMGLCRFFFISGEFLLLRATLRNYLLLILASGSFLLVLNFALPSVLMARGRWKILETSVSPDGKYLAVYESQSEYEAFHRVTVVDVGKLSRIGTFEFRSRPMWVQQRCFWSQTGNVLNILVADQPPIRSLLSPPSDSVQQLSPDCRELGMHTFSSGAILEFVPLQEGDALAIVGGAQKLMLLSLQTGETKDPVGVIGSELWTGIAPLDHGDLVRSQGPMPRAWLYDTALKGLTYVPDNNYSGAFLMGDTVYDSPSVFRKEVARVYPPPGNITGNYICPYRLTRVPPVFYLHADAANRTAELYVATASGGLWRQIAAGVPLTDRDVPALGQQDLSALDAVAIDYRNRVAAFVTRQAGTTEVGVYDMNRDLVLRGGSAAPGARTSVQTKRVLGMSGVLVVAGLSTGGVFEYVSATGLLKHLAIGSWDLLYRDDQGNEVFRSQETEDRIYRMSATGEKRQLWPPQ